MYIRFTRKKTHGLFLISRVNDVKKSKQKIKNNEKRFIMKALIAVGIGLCIAFSPVGRIPAVKIFIKAVTGG